MNIWTSLLVALAALACVALLVVGPSLARRRASLSMVRRRRLARLMPWIHTLDTRRRARLHARTARILRDIELLGDTGRALDDDQRLAVAGQVAMLCLGAQPNQPRLPAEIVVHDADTDGEWPGPPLAGVLEDLGEMATGESWQGPRLHVAWPEQRAALEGGPRNPIVRQIVRLQDFSGPTTATAGDQTWDDALAQERRHVRATRSSPLSVDEDLALDEFFGQAAEAFFQRGEALAGAHPDLYAVLAAYFDIETAPRRPCGHRSPAIASRP